MTETGSFGRFHKIESGSAVTCNNNTAAMHGAFCLGNAWRFFLKLKSNKNHFKFDFCFVFKIHWFQPDLGSRRVAQDGFSFDLEALFTLKSKPVTKYMRVKVSEINFSQKQSNLLAVVLGLVACVVCRRCRRRRGGGEELRLRSFYATQDLLEAPSSIELPHQANTHVKGEHTNLFILQPEKDYSSCSSCAS